MYITKDLFCKLGIHKWDTKKLDEYWDIKKLDEYAVIRKCQHCGKNEYLVGRFDCGDIKYFYREVDKNVSLFVSMYSKYLKECNDFFKSNYE